jgi:hypothetical protein
MKKHVAALLFAVAVIVAPPSPAQDTASLTDMAALRAAVKTDKKALVASTLNLTDAEAKRFWPIYAAYQRDLDMLNQRRNVLVVDLVELNRPLSDLYAKKLASEFIAIDEAEIKARRTLQNRLMRGVPTRILPPAKAARYLQLEAKIRAVLDYDIASTIPLVK